MSGIGGAARGPGASPAGATGALITPRNQAGGMTDDADGPDVAVLRGKIHGMRPAEYAAALRDRLPGRDVALARTPAEERDLLSRARVATGRNVDPDAVTPSLELFSCVFAGTDHLPLDALERDGVAVTNAAGVHGPNVAEHVVGAMLAFARGFPTAWRQGTRRQWQSFQSRELRGSTATVIGLGAIGTAVADRLEPFGVHTVGVRHSPEKGGPVDEVVGLGDGAAVHGALARSEYVVLACPLTPETRGLIDAEALASMPPDAVLVNVGRGPIVETDALLSSLRSNGIGGAALDVTDPEPLPPDHPLWGLDDVLITPHNAGHTPRYFERRADILAGNLDRIEAGEPLRNRVA